MGIFYFKKEIEYFLNMYILYSCQRYRKKRRRSGIFRYFTIIRKKEEAYDLIYRF